VTERPEATIVQAAPAARGSAPPVIQFAGGSQQTDDLKALLQKRLGFAATILAVLYVYYGPVLVPVRVERGDWFFLVFSLVAWVLEGLMALWLWLRPGLSIRTLRWIEVAVVGVPFSHQVIADHFPIYIGDVLREHVHGGLTPFFTARAQVLLWFALIVGYAIVIPNTWRRCLIVVAVFVTIATVTNFVAVSRAGLFDDARGSRYMLEFGIWLVFGVIFAVYNAYRIGVLRDSALKARKLGQYRLLQKLGAGGMGEVYLAEHALLRRPCAIKLIRPDQAVDPTALARFEREVQATATLTHPNTVQIFDYGRAEGTFYCVMEYLPGLALDKLVERHGPLPADRAVFVARQIASALQEAHTIGLIHRDVKPGNVILCDRGGRADTVKLLDFGLVLQQSLGDDKMTKAGVILGTPAYMSPEQAEAAESVDVRSDVYSLGATLHFLLTGRPPFVGGSAVRTIAAHLSDPVRPPKELVPHLPDDLQTVVLRCLAKLPGERFQSARELDAALAACECASQWTTEDASRWWQGHTADAGSVGGGTTADLAAQRESVSAGATTDGTVSERHGRIGS
jgi:eukaryotic-like serine/threonine-protein kinase